MKFTTLASVLASASVAFGAFCGHPCDPSRTPSSPLQGKISLVAVTDINNPTIKYQISGDITIINDCKFKVENFVMFPDVSVARWMGAPVDSTEAVGLTKEGAVRANDPAQPQNLEYDVSDVDPFCKASLLDNVGKFNLVDSNYQLLATATVNPNLTQSASEENSKKNGNGKANATSDAKTSKWSMALLGLTTVAGYLLA